MQNRPGVLSMTLCSMKLAFVSRQSYHAVPYRLRVVDGVALARRKTLSEGFHDDDRHVVVARRRAGELLQIREDLVDRRLCIGGAMYDHRLLEPGEAELVAYLV